MWWCPVFWINNTHCSLMLQKPSKALFLTWQVSGDFGELEDPTPWEVQEAIIRIKDRERRRGVEAARAEMAAIRSFETAEMRQRVTAAMQRIGKAYTFQQALMAFMLTS